MNKKRTVNETPKLRKTVYQQDGVIVEEYDQIINNDGQVTVDLTRILPLTGDDPVVLDIAIKTANGRPMGTITLEDERQLDAVLDMLSWYRQQHWQWQNRKLKGGAK